MSSMTRSKKSDYRRANSSPFPPTGPATATSLYRQRRPSSIETSTVGWLPTPPPLLTPRNAARSSSSWNTATCAESTEKASSALDREDIFQCSDSSRNNTNTFFFPPSPRSEVDESQPDEPMVSMPSTPSSAASSTFLSLFTSSSLSASPLSPVSAYSTIHAETLPIPQQQPHQMQQQPRSQHRSHASLQPYYQLHLKRISLSSSSHESFWPDMMDIVDDNELQQQQQQQPSHLPFKGETSDRDPPPSSSFVDDGVGGMMVVVTPILQKRNRKTCIMEDH